MEISFLCKRALVTGAGKGLGRALAIKLAKAGAEVVAVSRTQSDLDDLAKCDPKIKPLCLNVAEWEKAKSAVKAVGPIDLLVNNAAALAPLKNFGDIDEKDIDDIHNTNVKAVINFTQEIARNMKERGKGGSIVNVSSIASFRFFPGAPIYSATKAALDALTRSMAAEYGPYNIRVNSVNPTFIKTQLTAAFETTDVYKNMKEKTPLRKFCEVEDAADPILFLLSDRAALITGVSLPVDGGITICL